MSAGVVFDLSSPQPCRLCGAEAVVPLPPALLARQPDKTTHVCFPLLGGCNHGFAIEPGTWHCLYCHAPLQEGEYCPMPRCVELRRGARQRMGLDAAWTGNGRA